MPRHLILLFLSLSLVACASNKAKDSVAFLDISATRLVSDANGDIAEPMTAEVVYVKDLMTQQVLYRLDVLNRKKMDIADYIYELAPGRYQIGAVCTAKNFTNRIMGLKSLDTKDERTWRARLITSSQTEAFLPATSFEVNINGKEQITVVNISPIGNNQCKVVFGDARLNLEPKSFTYEEDFRKKYSRKLRLYN